jgi:hypothetical protein
MSSKSIAAAVCAMAIVTTSYLVVPAEARIKKEHLYDQDRYAARAGLGRERTRELTAAFA